MLLGENTAKQVGGRHLKKRYIDIIDGKKDDGKTCEEIAADVIKRAGLAVKNESI